MGKKIRTILIGILIFSFFVTNYDQPVFAQTEDPWYSQDSGHTVRGEFLRKYRSTSDSARIFGFPITDDYISTASGLRIQYFQRALFELHPENPPDQQIVVFPLGKYWFSKDNPGTGDKLADNHPACRSFPKTGHQVCYAFLDFYNEYNGEVFFGNPLSDIVTFRGRMVQYFDYVRFEWHPELPSGQRVTLSNLGLLYFQGHEDQSASFADAAPSLVTNLRINAFVKSAVVSQTGSQTIYVIVQDQNFNPLSDAQVRLSIMLPSGQKKQINPPLTNSSGYTSSSFTLNETEIGFANVEVIVNYSITPEKSTRVAFRIWY